MDRLAHAGTNGSVADYVAALDRITQLHEERTKKQQAGGGGPVLFSQEGLDPVLVSRYGSARAREMQAQGGGVVPITGGGGGNIVNFPTRTGGQATGTYGGYTPRTSTYAPRTGGKAPPNSKRKG